MNTSGLQTNSNPATNALVPSPNPVCFLQSWAHDRQSLGATLSAWVAPVPLYFYPFKDQKGTIYVQVELRGSRGGSRLRGRDVDTSEERAGDLQTDRTKGARVIRVIVTKDPPGRPRGPE